MAKDLFSAQSQDYARYRPGYPPDLFEFLSSLTENHETAWDCATGNGQAASGLSQYYKKIIATDISEKQMSFGIQKDNIQYKVGAAENSGLENESADLITVSQAYHWLNWDQFHKEAHRVGKPNAVVAVWMYNRMMIENPVLEELYERFYFDIMGPYWDPERRYVDDNYETVKFDFKDASRKQFQSVVNWTIEEFMGYLASWSANQKFQIQNKHSAVDLIKNEVRSAWKNVTTRRFIFPVYMRYGKV